MIGDRLLHYEIAARLGAGGMGEVYRAHDTRLGRDVALKVLPEEVAGDVARLERFKREAKTLAALSHPNIVTVYAVEEAAEVPFITMEMVDGRPLSECIGEGGETREHFFAMAIPLADALAAAHERGVIHRDLKPANVMVMPDRRVKVLDFGLAKQVQLGTGPPESSEVPTLDLETQPGTVMGTLGYMSPEQLRGQAVDARSDVFALGLILYELATGARAFDAETSPDIVSAILRDSPPPVDEVRSDLPHHLGRIIRRCLEKDPARRYRSARDLCNELEDLAKELERAAILERGSRSAVEKRPRIGYRWILVATAGVVILAGVVAHRLARVGLEPPASVEQGEIESLAVLPFDNLMNDPAQDYFVDGMHEALITNLSKLGALRIISRTSVMRYRETQKPVPEIARELDVEALIEGSVLRVDNQVRITAQLIDGRTDEHLWAESFDRELEDVLVLLSEVAQVIAARVEIAVTPERRDRLTAVRAVDPAAHEAYLKGRYSFNTFTAEGYRRSIEYFRQAIELQTDFADAYASLAGSHLLLGGFGIESRREHEDLARGHALRALELDERLPVTHSVLGWIKLYFEWDWPGAAAKFERALELDPTEPYANHGMADYLAVVGRAEEGLEYLERAARVDPLSPLVNTPVAGHLLMTRRYEEAIEKCHRLLDLDPGYPAARWFLAWAHWHNGDYDQALAGHRLRWQGDDELIEALERGLALDGPRGALREVAKVLTKRTESGRTTALDVAGYYARAGDVDEALSWLERAFEGRESQLMLINAWPTWDSLRSDPRFGDLARRIGVP